MTSDLPEEPHGLSRQEFLRRTGWLVGGVWAGPFLVGCESDGPVPTPTASSASLGEGDLPFSVWRAIRDSVRSSPGHLIRRADRLVDAGDADAIVRFVQEEIRTFPGGLQHFGHPPTAVRWGTRATLRCGAAPSRPRAAGAGRRQLQRRALLRPRVVGGHVRGACRRGPHGPQPHLRAVPHRDRRGEGRVPRSVTRTLGGYDERHLGSPVTTDHVRDAHGAVFGSYLLHVEAADPPVSVWLDDLISSRLTLEPLVGALARPDGTDLLEAMEQTPRSVPPEVYTLTGPLGRADDDGALVYQEGLRVVMHSLVPVFGTDHVERRIDVLPTAVCATALEDGVEAFRHAMRATAGIAVAESELYETTTRSLLEDRDLRLAGSALAVWDIDRDTGALLGMLADGRGGGNAERAIKEQLQAFNDVMTTYDLLFEAIFNVPGMTLGPALPVVAQYGKALVKLYAAVTFVLINMDPSGLDDLVRETLLEFACEVNKQVFIGVLTSGHAPAEQAASLFRSLSGLLGLFYSDDPFSC